MGRWTEQLGTVISKSKLVPTDKTDRGKDESPLSVMSVPHLGLSGNSNKEGIIQKVTLPTTDIADRSTKSTPLSVMSVPQIGKFSRNPHNKNISETPIPPTDKTDTSCKHVLARFCSLVRHAGISNGKLLDDVEILRELDAEGIRELANASREVRIAWATAVAHRLIRHRGLVPAGWDKIAHCESCGPVYSYYDANCISCPWCELRRAGKWFSRPRVSLVESDL